MKFPSAARPAVVGQTHRCRRQKPLVAIIISGYCQGEALAGRNQRRVGPRWPRDEAGKLIPIDLKVGDPRACSARWSGNEGQASMVRNC